MKQLLTCAFLLSALTVYGQSVASRRATMTGSPGANGNCTIEVNVDGVVEIELAGERAELHTLSGTPAEWVRFECSDALPRLPQDFKFKGAVGRGRQALLRDPRGNRGVAVVRIEDPKDGREGYTFDIEWRGFGSVGQGTFGRYDKDRGAAQTDPEKKRSIESCTDAVREKADRDFGYRNLEFGKVGFDETSTRRDSITGRFIFRRTQSADEFQFSCSMDLKKGRVRKVEMRRW